MDLLKKGGAAEKRTPGKGGKEPDAGTKADSRFSPGKTVDLVISMLRAFASGQAFQATDFDFEVVDRPLFQEIMRRHRLAGILYHTARRSQGFPLQYFEQWRTSLIRHSASNVQAGQRLLVLLAALQQRGIEAAPFKGLVLAHDLYDDFTLRPTTDFDLYVETADAAPAVQFFLEQGYISPLFTGAIPPSLLQKVYTLELFHPQRKEYVDIHLDLTDGYVDPLFSRSELAARLETRPFEGAMIRGFDDQVTASMIVVHGAKNSWDQLIALLDLALFFRRYPKFDYEELLMRLRSRGVSRMLLIGSELVRRFALAPVPGVLQRAADKRVQRIALRIEQKIRRRPLQPSPSRWAKVAQNLAFRERISAKLSYISFKMRPKKIDMADSNANALLVRARRVLGLS